MHTRILWKLTALVLRPPWGKSRPGARREPEREDAARPLLATSLASAFFHVLNDRAPASDELGALVDELRARRPSLRAQLSLGYRGLLRGATRSATARAERELPAIYREVLARPVDERSAASYRTRLALGLADGGTVRRELEESPEFRTVVAPLRAEIDRIYRTIVLRPPGADEVQDALDRFRTRFETLEEQQDAIQRGEARIHLGIRPLKLELDITSQCNLRCVMCYLALDRFSKRERVDLSLSEFELIAEQVFPYCSHVSLSIGTEPLLNGRCEDMIEVARRYGVPWIYLNTNALLLNEERIERILGSGLHGFAISIDAATEETYERVRAGGRFARLMTNIRALNEAKQRHGSRYPVLTFNFVMMRSNIHELPALVDLAHELDVEGLAAMHMVPVEGLDRRDEALDAEPELCNRMMAEARERARACDLEVSFPEPFALDGALEPGLKPTTPVGFQLNEDHAPDASRCKFPWVFVGIDPYGNVAPCGWWFTEPAMGNILAQDFESIWNSDAYRELRREHVERHLRATCKACPAAGMGGVNDPKAFAEARLGDTPSRA